MAREWKRGRARGRFLALLGRKEEKHGKRHGMEERRAEAGREGGCVRDDTFVGWKGEGPVPITGGGLRLCVEDSGFAGLAGGEVRSELG